MLTERETHLKGIEPPHADPDSAALSTELQVYSILKQFIIKHPNFTVITPVLKFAFCKSSTDDHIIP